jgi:Cytochrome c oxidase subunit IV
MSTPVMRILNIFPKGLRIPLGVAGIIGVGVMSSIPQYLRRDIPHTFNKEWEDANVEYAHTQNSDPFTVKK